MEIIASLKKYKQYLTAIILIILVAVFLALRLEENNNLQTGETNSITDINRVIPTADSRNWELQTDLHITEENEEALLSETNGELTIPLPNSTASDLTNKGLPLMPHFRRKVYEQTTKQTIPEVVADLGNILVTMWCDTNLNMTAPGFEIMKWRNEIMPNMKVLRLIEEGRKNPDYIADLVETAISECMKDYNDIHMKFDIEWAKQESHTLRENDPYYEEHKRYDNPMHEAQRVNFIINASFYILINIDRFDNPKLLSEWIETKKIADFDSLEMEIWLIDTYFRMADDEDSRYYENHKLLTKDMKIPDPTQKTMSAWDAPWDIHDFMLAAASVDVSDIETIDVLEIPPKIGLTDIIPVYRTFDNFHEYCENMD